jgi:hypothetical protein
MKMMLFFQVLLLSMIVANASIFLGAYLEGRRLAGQCDAIKAFVVDGQGYACGKLTKQEDKDGD